MAKRDKDAENEFGDINDMGLGEIPEEVKNEQ